MLWNHRNADESSAVYQALATNAAEAQVRLSNAKTALDAESIWNEIAQQVHPMVLKADSWQNGEFYLGSDSQNAIQVPISSGSNYTKLQGPGKPITPTRSFRSVNVTEPLRAHFKFTERLNDIEMKAACKITDH